MKNSLKITLSCNGRKLILGPDADLDITAVTGLETSDLEVNTSDNALVDGATVEGVRIKARPIHIEAAFRDLANNRENRAAVIRFFNPKYPGSALIESMGVPRTISYQLEGWTFAKRAHWDDRLRLVIDLLCPDPYMLNVDNFGKNLAAITPLFSFPWYSLRTRMESGKMDYPAESRGLLLGGAASGYRTLRQQATLTNDGDVPTGLKVVFTAARGSVTNPKITNAGTGEYMRVVLEMQQGDVLVVDTDLRHQVIELNGTNCYQYIDRSSEPFQLEIGDNYLEYDADENYTNLDVNVYYTPKYLGI